MKHELFRYRPRRKWISCGIALHNNVFHEQLFEKIKNYLNEKETEWKEAGGHPYL